MFSHLLASFFIVYECFCTFESFLHFCDTFSHVFIRFCMIFMFNVALSYVLARFILITRISQFFACLNMFTHVLHIVVRDCTQLMIVTFPYVYYLMYLYAITARSYLLHIIHCSSLVIILCTNIMSMGGPIRSYSIIKIALHGPPISKFYVL